MIKAHQPLYKRLTNKNKMNWRTSLKRSLKLGLHNYLRKDLWNWFDLLGIILFIVAFTLSFTKTDQNNDNDVE